jgi:hypothetical protein
MTDKINVDIVILSYAKDKSFEQITRTGIDSLLKSEDNINFHVYVVETNLDVNYDDYSDSNHGHTVKTIRAEQPFNYFKFANVAIKLGTSEYVAICNNDLTYESYWAQNIIDVMSSFPDIMSASPWCPQTQKDNSQHIGKIYVGCRVRVELAGWCIFQQRRLYETIGKMNDDTDFWYGDDIYRDELTMRGIKHALIASSVVNHHDGNLGPSGTQLLDQKTMQDFTTGQQEKYAIALEKLKEKLKITK